MSDQPEIFPTQQPDYITEISNRLGIAEISVIISFYGDYCNFGADCLASLMRQDFKDFEIIFIQDGPTKFQDRLQSDLLSCGLGYVYLINACNMGALESRIRASREALGKYIAFLDHDDTYCDRFLSTMYRVAKKYDADIVECSINNVCRDGSTELFRRFECGDRRFGQDIVIQYLRGYSHNNLWNKLIAKERLDASTAELAQEMSTVHLNFFEDLLLTILIYKNSSTYVATCDTCYNYVRRSGSNANPVEIGRVVSGFRQIVLIASYVNQKVSPICSDRDLRLFHKRETLWGLDHMSGRLKLLRPSKTFEWFQRQKYLAIAFALRYLVVSSPWLTLKFASKWRIYS